MDKKLMSLIAVFLLVFGVFMSLLFFGRRISSIRATANTASCDNSFIFLNTVDASVGNPVTAIVFVRNSDGDGLSRVALSCSSSLGTIAPANQVTDNLGKANFTISSTVSGVAEVSCQLANCGTISRTVSVRFNP